MRNICLCVIVAFSRRSYWGCLYPCLRLVVVVVVVVVVRQVQPVDLGGWPQLVVLVKSTSFEVPPLSPIIAIVYRKPWTRNCHANTFYLVPTQQRRHGEPG
jgi:hypothetical protein